MVGSAANETERGAAAAGGASGSESSAVAARDRAHASGSKTSRRMRSIEAAARPPRAFARKWLHEAMAEFMKPRRSCSLLARGSGSESSERVA